MAWLTAALRVAARMQLRFARLAQSRGPALHARRIYPLPSFLSGWPICTPAGACRHIASRSW